jgi:hypothetical protein
LPSPNREIERQTTNRKTATGNQQAYLAFGEKIADCRHPTPPPVHKLEQLQHLSTIETAKGKTEECKNGQQDEPNETATIVPNNVLWIVVMFIGLGSRDLWKRCSLLNVY